MDWDCRCCVKATERINFKWLLLSPLHSTTLALNTCHLYYILTLCCAALNLLSKSCINIALAARCFRHAGPSLWNSLSHHLRSIDSYTVFKFNIKLTFSLVQAFLAPNNYIHALLIRHSHVDFCVLKCYYVMLWQIITMLTVLINLK